MRATIDILCVTDDNYVPYCGIMLTSVFENNKAHQFRVYIIIGQPLKKKNAARLIKLGKKYGHTVSFILGDMSSLNDHPLVHDGDHVSIATYYRLFAGELLPKSLSRVLYLDGDIIVTGDLSQLWETDLTGKAVAAVADAVWEQERPKSLHYPEEAGYFNAGVLMMNLDYWRAKGVGRQCLDFLENHHDILMFHDQDVLNAVLWDKKICLPLKYNYQVTLLFDYCFDEEQIKARKKELETSGNPFVIHFCRTLKPWMISYYKEPFWEIWESYKKKSPWFLKPPIVPHRKGVNWLIKYYILWPLGIKK